MAVALGAKAGMQKPLSADVSRNRTKSPFLAIVRGRQDRIFITGSGVLCNRKAHKSSSRSLRRCLNENVRRWFASM